MRINFTDTLNGLNFDISLTTQYTKLYWLQFQILRRINLTNQDTDSILRLRVSVTESDIRKPSIRRLASTSFVLLFHISYFLKI